MHSNLYDILKQKFPKKRNSELFIIPGEKSWTYNEIDSHSARLANLFIALGMKPGDRLIAMIEKSVFSLCIYFGCLRSGIIYVPLNTAYTNSEIEYFIKNSNPKIFICDPSNKQKILGLKFNNILTVDQKGQGSALEKSLSYDINFNKEEFSEDTLAVVLYSSGTTGISKGIAMTHKALEINSRDLGKIWKLSQRDTILHALPIFHTHGLFVAINTALMHGCKIIFHNRFREKETIDSLKDSTIFMGIPTYYQRMLSTDKLSSESCSNIRLFISGSAPLMQETSDNFKNRTGHNIIERYGMSESGIITSNPLNTNNHLEGNVGFPLPNQKIRIADKNDKILEQEQIGEIQIKGPNLFSFYWNRPELKKKNLTQDNFFRTGDLGKINNDGSLQLAGRNSDMFISGGFNVYPKEIEKLLNKHPDVFESVVVGMPHSDYGEAGMAVIVTHENKKINFEKVKSYLKEGLAKYKIPKMFFTIKRLPRNTMGKVNKNFLKTEFSSDWKKF